MTTLHSRKRAREELRLVSCRTGLVKLAGFVDRQLAVIDLHFSCNLALIAIYFEPSLFGGLCFNVTSLIVIHGVGNPSSAELAAATQGIAAAFSAVREGDRHYVDWNTAAADRVLENGIFRWRSVERLFGALWRAVRA